MPSPTSTTTLPLAASPSKRPQLHQPGQLRNAGVQSESAPGSTFTTVGSGNYNQSGGSTKVDGALVGRWPSASINGGTLARQRRHHYRQRQHERHALSRRYTGAAGALAIVGNYAQTSAGIFQLELGGLTPGSQFDLLNVSGTTNLTGTLDVSLINGFFPAVGNTFTFLTSGGTRTGSFSITNGLNIGGGEILNVVYGSNFVELSTALLFHHRSVERRNGCLEQRPAMEHWRTTACV